MKTMKGLNSNTVCKSRGVRFSTPRDTPIAAWKLRDKVWSRLFEESSDDFFCIDFQGYPWMQRRFSEMVLESGLSLRVLKPYGELRGHLSHVVATKVAPVVKAMEQLSEINRTPVEGETWQNLTTFSTNTGNS
jgi:hypothetical protein